MTLLQIPALSLRYKILVLYESTRFAWETGWLLGLTNPDRRYVVASPNSRLRRQFTIHYARPPAMPFLCSGRYRWRSSVDTPEEPVRKSGVFMVLLLPILRYMLPGPRTQHFCGRHSDSLDENHGYVSSKQ